MAATVKIDVTPTEFDLLRKALKAQAEMAHEIVKSRTADAPTRSAMRTHEAQLLELLRRLA